MPEGARSPTMPDGFTSVIALSTNKRINVQVAAREKRIIAVCARHAACCLGPLVGLGKVVASGSSAFPAPRSCASGRSPLRHGDFAPACSEPFDLLQLHPIPWRIADHGVKPAGQPVVLPIRPHAGESDLPIQETFFGDKLAGLGEDFGEARRFRTAITRSFRLPMRDPHRIAKLPVKNA